MTRPEITGRRPSPLSKWQRTRLPDSETGFIAYDIDMVFYYQENNSNTAKLMFIEEKTYNKQPAFAQKKLYAIIDKLIKYGIMYLKKNNINFNAQFKDNYNKKKIINLKNIEYMGFHLLVWEKDSFQNGRVYFDNEIVTEEELQEKLSLGGKMPEINNEQLTLYLEEDKKFMANLKESGYN